MTAERPYRAGAPPQIRLAACRDCGHRVFPPVFLGCEKCGASGGHLEEVWQAASGQVLSSVKVPDDGAEITVATIALEGGPRVRGLLDDVVEPGTGVTGRIEDDKVIFGSSP